MSRYPNIIFSSLTGSGASAIDPILRDLLPTLGYDLIPVYPHNTQQLPEYLGGEKPIYHWTHDPAATYADLLSDGDYKFLFLYRDPRDVLVCMAKDYIYRGLATDSGYVSCCMPTCRRTNFDAFSALMRRSRGCVRSSTICPRIVRFQSLYFNDFAI